jgi:ABC-type multidrug transport system ATPase subunit
VARGVIEVRGLRKSYRSLRGRRRLAVDGLDMTVPAGGVHGFLGPNGSGKTTTIRTLLGLVSADAGSMRILGHDVPADLPAVIGRVGAVVEQPQFFPAFSGRRNLALLAAVAGLDLRRVDEVLDVVGLTERAREPFRAYSLGMKQRLAIAATLLKRPDILVLDEPMNGLDPAGIREVRLLMRRLAYEGTSILLSSHLLAEVQQVCDSVSIISRGRHLASGSVGEVLASGGTEEVRVGLSDLEAGARVLADAGLAVRRLDSHLLVSGVPDPSRVTEILASQELYVSELMPVAPDLESVFLELTGNEQASPRPSAGPVERPAARHSHRRRR